MTTQEIAKRYYELMKQNKVVETQDELYAEEVISIEPEHIAASGAPVITRGFDEVRIKGDKRREMIEAIHKQECSEPLVAGNYFSVALARDITLKGQPHIQLNEIAVFHVKDGKIISEQFFF